MSEKFKIEDLGIESNLLNDSIYHDKIKMSALVFIQIERINKSAGDPLIYANNIRNLMKLIPTNKKIELDERSNEYISTQKRLEYKYCCNVPMGTKEHPINGSPYEVEEEVIDWFSLYGILLEILEDSGVTWKTDHQTIDLGKVPEKKKKIDIKPTPVFAEGESEPEVTVAKKKEYIRRCTVCGERVLPGTGKIYNRRLVHIDPCLTSIQEVKNEE